MVSAQVTGRSNDQDCTVDELASESGVPVRTLREYQRLGLLPAPERRGRVGYYGQQHRARLAIIRRLQDRGYSLAAIGDLIGSWEEGRGLVSVLGVGADPAVLDETPTQISLEQLCQVAPVFVDTHLVEVAVSGGLLSLGPAGSIGVRSMAALELVALAVEAGMPSVVAVELATSLVSGARLIATAAVDRFVDHVWVEGTEVDLVPVLARARLLLAQAAASMVVHELGVALAERAGEDQGGELADLLDRVAIGQIRRLG